MTDEYESADKNWKVFTVGQFIDAIEKNGLPQSFGYLWGNTVENVQSRYHSVGDLNQPNCITQACALGQGYINLGVAYISEDNIINTGYTSRFDTLLSTIFHFNDDLKLTIVEIASRVRTDFADILNQEIRSPSFDYSNYIKKEA